MLDQLKNRWYGYYVSALFFAALIGVVLLFFYHWVIGIAGLFVLAALVYLAILSKRAFERDLESYISTLSHRVKKVGDEALTAMPIGILLYNEHYQIQWINRYIHSLLGEESFHGHSLNHISEELIPCIKGQVDQEMIKINKREFRVHFKREERLLYFFDVTEHVKVQRLYREEETVLGIIYLDNYEELTQSMDDQVRSHINSEVTSIVKQWATDNGIFLKRNSSEKFSAVFNQRILRELEKAKFGVLDRVRESTAKENVPLTLSIGIGSGLVPLPELGELAQSSLDLALGRGGDQVAIKQTDGKVTFHGGKTNPIEKRTRVRARVISHALRELILESDKVMIMGHVNPDMDAIGSAIGILKVAEANGKDGFIVLDKQKQKQEIGIRRLIQEVKKDESLWSKFIPPDEAVEAATNNTLLVVVDTHRPSFVIESRLINKIEQVVVIDHHRRGEEFIADPVLVYMEPYASSTSELVTELLEYQPSRLKMNVLEATSLLTGINVDTKSFTLRTGSRTFDAASYLRAHGADTILVQRLLREDLQQYIKRAKLIEHTEMYREGFAIATSEDSYDQVMLAQAADTLLSMSGVIASFVFSKRGDGKTGISARSLGDINVQIMMESLGGGGHLTNAAAQLDNVGLDKAVQTLKEIIDQTLEGGDEE